MVSSEKKKNKLIGWYTVSSDALRGWIFALIFLVLALGGVLGYRLLDHAVLEREVERVIQEAEDLLRTVRTEGAINSYREEYFVARRHLEEAREHQKVDELREAFRSAERSRTLLASIFGTLRLRGPEGEAMFIAVQGKVEYRRGDRGPWQTARSRVALNSGDYVKTSGSGSAEVMSVDGTLYTVRPNTVLLIGRVRPAPGAPRQRTLNLESGWVDLGTSQSTSHITTPQAEAHIQRDTRAAIGHDPDRDVSKFSAFEGEMVVSSNDGTSSEIGPLEQVVQTQGRLSQPERLLSPPALLGPDDNYEAVLTTEQEIILLWGPVDGAQRYALQVARNRFFVQNIIDVEDRSKTSALMGLQGIGSFVWRVAAFDGEGVMGPWSAPRRFRVTAGAEPTATTTEDLPGPTSTR